MRIRVLGPVEVVGDDGSLRALAPKARQVLAILALKAPRAVSLDELTGLLWDDPPPAATKSIQAHVSRLRAALGDGATIERSGVGYALRATAGTCDVDRFAEHRTAARRLSHDGRFDAAAAELASARSLWRGDLELPDSAAAAGLAARWNQEHHLLVDEHLAAVVDGTDPDRALSELRQATAVDPLDERRWALLVRALHRGGDVRGALRAYQSARAALAEAGLHPGPALRDAEAGALTTPSAAPPLPGRSVPTAMARSLAAVRYADTGRGRVAYIVIGEGEVQTVVLNPGCISIDSIAQQPRLVDALARLAGHGAVACLDRRCIGLSDPVLGSAAPPAPTIDDWVGDVVAVLDALGARPVVLAASDTALVALGLAAAHPDRVAGIALVHAYPRYLRGDGYPYGIDPDTAAATKVDLLAVDGGDPAFDGVAYVAPSLASDLGFRQWFDVIGLRAASPSVKDAVYHAVVNADLRGVLPDVDVPVLLLHRRSCATTDIGHARYLREHLPRAELVLLPGADELWFVGDVGAVLEQIELWRRPEPQP